MASTYSQNLKIELMGIGDQVDSWGDTTNENLGTTLEEAIVGYGAVQFTNDANLTLTLSNSNETQTARKFFLYVTSTVSLSTQRDLIVPTIEKTYTVHNNTTGSQAIRVKTSAGTGVVVPSGKKMVLYANGTNVIEQMDYATSLTVGALSISTPLPIASGGTGASAASGARTNLGLGTIATQNSNSVAITGGSITGITDLAVSDGGTGASTAADARTNLGLGTIATQNSSSVTITGGSIAGVSITGGSITGITDLAIADGGTGASTAADARTNLGLGTIATQNSSSVTITGGSITGITDLALADGGTGASDASGARTNLGLGSIATQASNSVSITGGSITGITDLAVADGGTGSSTASGARSNLSAAASGANSDITALSGLTTALSIAQGGTGATTASAARTALGLAIGTDVQAYDANLRPLVSSTVVNSTSGTAIDFTGIPSWVKRITVMFNGVSTNGTSLVQIQIGSGSFTTSGYTSTAGNAGANAVSTTGFITSVNPSAADFRVGVITLTLFAGNSWAEHGVVGITTINSPTSSCGIVAISGTLDRVRITTVNGTDTFDSGSINILYE